MLTQERLKELLSYDPDTGVFTWRVNRRRAHIGDVASNCTGRYIQIKIDRKNYLAHRAAWLYQTGEWPPEFIDHIDRNGMNNRWENLRLATNSQNQANRSMLSNNKTGIRGVEPVGRKFLARIIIDGNTKFLGCHETVEAARDAYSMAARQHFREFAPGGLE